MSDSPENFCRRTRREFLWQAGAGFTGLGLVDLLSRDRFFAKAADAKPMLRPRASYCTESAVPVTVTPKRLLSESIRPRVSTVVPLLPIVVLLQDVTHICPIDPRVR